MYDRILVPTDGSDQAVRAANHGAMLAQQFDATLHLLTVVDVEAAAGPFSAGGIDESYIETLTAESRAELETLESRIEGGGPVETSVVTGEPVEGILDYVTENGIDLVCMGSHGRSGLRRFLIGSIAERVVRLSPVPVLTVRATDTDRPDNGYEEMLVPTDGSSQSSVAERHALALAKQFGSRIHAVSVINVGDIATGTETTVPPGLIEELEQTAAEATASIEGDAAAAGVDATTAVSVGSPKRELLAYTSENDIDLICMGTHGRTGLNRVLLGSTAEAIVRRADAPVLTVSTADTD